ncbi:hypothetical protein GPJ56_003414 [Histomonas meleagridis]|uniref:uncharacterized protein n=1 Tax=Histomonas meleagridis TaxID=135588 RepID=UPI00355A8008|nr:hypothetical protein GPJ56_003414 [Histomonas meleagridis]KAH0799105.1 hypothetical protein GO595_007902 [Histomonas meleagridis]
MKPFLKKLFGWVSDDVEIPNKPIYLDLPGEDYYRPKSNISNILFRPEHKDTETQTECSLVTAANTQIMTDPLNFDINIFNKNPKPVPKNIPFELKYDLFNTKFGLQADNDPPKITFKPKVKFNKPLISCSTAPHFEFTLPGASTESGNIPFPEFKQIEWKSNPQNTELTPVTQNKKVEPSTEPTVYKSDRSNSVNNDIPESDNENEQENSSSGAESHSYQESDSSDSSAGSQYSEYSSLQEDQYDSSNSTHSSSEEDSSS